MLALTVSVRVRPELIDEFTAAITHNAERTFTDERGCRYFDVSQDITDPQHFIFYELYDDDDAVQAHRAAPHFAVWRAAAERCVEPGSQVNTLTRRLLHHS